MDSDFGEKKFRTGSAVVTVNFMCLPWQDPVGKAVNVAEKYGYELTNVSQSPVRYAGIQGTQYTMVFKKTSRDFSTIQQTQIKEIQQEEDYLGDPGEWRKKARTLQFKFVTVVVTYIKSALIFIFLDALAWLGWYIYVYLAYGRTTGLALLHDPIFLDTYLVVTFIIVPTLFIIYNIIYVHRTIKSIEKTKNEIKSIEKKINDLKRKEEMERPIEKDREGYHWNPFKKRYVPDNEE